MLLPLIEPELIFELSTKGTEFAKAFQLVMTDGLCLSVFAAVMSFSLDFVIQAIVDRFVEIYS